MWKCRQKGLPNLFDLSGQHAALYAQHGGDVDVLPAHVVHPLGEAVHRGLEKLPGELYDVEHSLDNVVWGGGGVGKNNSWFSTTIETRKCRIIKEKC